MITAYSVSSTFTSFLLYQDGFDEDEDKKGKIIEQSIPGGEVYDVSEGGLTVVKSVGREEEYTIKLPNFKISIVSESGVYS